MVDPDGMTVSHRVQDLKKGIFGQGVIADKSSPLGDVGKEVAFGTKFDDNESAVRVIQNPHQRDHIGVLAGFVVELHLPLLKPPLSWVESRLSQGLDGVWDVRSNVDGGVDDSVCSNAEDRGQLQPVGQYAPKSFLRRQ